MKSKSVDFIWGKACTLTNSSKPVLK